MIWLVLGGLEVDAEYAAVKISVLDEGENVVVSFEPKPAYELVQTPHPFLADTIQTRYVLHLELAVPVEVQKPRFVRIELALTSGAKSTATFKCGFFNSFAPLPPPSRRVALLGSNGASLAAEGVLFVLYWWHEAPTHVEPPKLALRTDTDSPGVDEELAMALSLTSTSKTHVTNTISTGGGKRWFCQPGCYSGDDWVAAAALLVDPTLRGFLVTYEDGQVKKSQYLGKTVQAQRFYERCGVADRVVTLYLDQVRQHEAVEHLEPCRMYLKSRPKLGRPLDVGLVNITTSVLMRAIEKEGVAAIVARLREAFTAGLSKEARKRIRARLEPLRLLLEAGKRVVLVNMRITTYNIENIITPEIYAQLARVAGSFDCDLVRVGVYQDDRAHKQYGRWTLDLTTPALDLYGVGEVGVKVVDMRETAFFWATIADWQLKVDGRLLGVVGGRSGSLDIAAFMGVRTLCYDTVNSRDWEYIRLFMTFPLMSIVARSGLPSRPERSAKLDDFPDLVHGTMVTHALGSWMLGRNVIPGHADRSFFLPQYRYLMNVRSSPIDPREPYLGYLAYMRRWVDDLYVETSDGSLYEAEKQLWEPETPKQQSRKGKEKMKTEVVYDDMVDEQAGPSSMQEENSSKQELLELIRSLESDLQDADIFTRSIILSQLASYRQLLKEQ